MGSGEYAWLVGGFIMTVFCSLASVKCSIEKKLNWKRYAYSFLALAIVFPIVCGLGFLQARSNRIMTDRATESVKADYPGIVIRDLSVSLQTITYELNGQVCSASLFRVDNRYVVAVQGAQCATIPGVG